MRANPHLLILMLGFVLSLSACGFKLAGTADLPQQLASIYLSDDGFDESQRKSLQRRLTQAGASLVGPTDTDAVKLRVSLKSVPDRRMATSASTGAIVTRITRQLDFSVDSAEGKTLLPMTTLTQQKDISLDQDNLLSSNREKETVTRNLEESLYDQLIRQLTLI